MAIYSLHEMAGLLKTGLWQGGEVEKLGYIGTAVPHASPAPACGLTGVYISYDTMLERCEVSMQGGGCELFISQYHPYTGTYMTYVLESNLSDRRLLLAKLEERLADRRNPYLWSHNLYKRNSFGIERRYDTGHSSMWGGRIAVPRQSKFFGR